jgi:hypothetical protein
MMDDDELLNWLDELLIALRATHDQAQTDSRSLSALLDELSCFRAEFHQRANAQEVASWTPSRGG